MLGADKRLRNPSSKILFCRGLVSLSSFSFFFKLFFLFRPARSIQRGIITMLIHSETYRRGVVLISSLFSSFLPFRKREERKSRLYFGRVLCSIIREIYRANASMISGQEQRTIPRAPFINYIKQSRETEEEQLNQKRARRTVRRFRLRLMATSHPKWKLRWLTRVSGSSKINIRREDGYNFFQQIIRRILAVSTFEPDKNGKKVFQKDFNSTRIIDD